MLASLHIENVAVIKSVDIDFSGGFMVLTGETGAGKSIIIDSINLLLGAKADKELIRTGESFCMVSGLFNELSDFTKEVLSDNGILPTEDGEILIQRTVSMDGKSSIKLNGRALTLSVLRAIGPSLVAIHGQSDTAELTNPKHQLKLIDVYAKNAELLSDYKREYSRLEEIKRKIKEISEREHERERLVEILEYQINDIDSHNLHDGEEEELVERKLKIKNSEKISKNAGFVFKALKGSEKGSVSFLLERCATALSQICDVLPKFSQYAETLRDYRYQVDDIAEEVYSSVSDIDEDPTEALNNIESRLDKISKLKRKYGLTIKDILAFREKAADELSVLGNSEAAMEKLKEEERIAYNSALKLANELHERRCEAALKIESLVKETLEFLDMPKVVFFASIKEEYSSGEKILSADGSDNVEFFISANRGAEAQPLSKVASGGELARVMLAIKGVISDKDGISTVIYDEIDAGVSGKTARKIGIKMRSLAKKTQLFSVTHSAQIASLADEHFLISKRETDGVTSTTVKVLDREGRIAELSRILGGIDITDAQRRAAIDMLDEKEIY